MKKAYELSTLTGTQVLLLVVSETGDVYSFTTAKLKPLVTQPEGQNLIQACLNAPQVDSIHRLPVEILSEVFLLACASSLDKSELDEMNKWGIPPHHHRLMFACNAVPYTVSSVCKRWRLIGLSTPKLWLKFTIPDLDFRNCRDSKREKSDHAKFIVALWTWLKQSKNHPLQFTCLAPSNIGDKVFVELFPNIHRWHMAYFLNHPPQKQWFGNNGFKSENLDTLEFNFDNYYDLDIAFEWFPNLRRLRIHPGSLTVEEAGSLSLTHLTLTYWGRNRNTAMATFFSHLRQFPSLISFEVSVPLDHNLNHLPLTTFTHTTLTELTITQYQDNIQFRDILANIHLPSIHRLCLKYRHGFDFHETLSQRVETADVVNDFIHCHKSTFTDFELSGPCTSGDQMIKILHMFPKHLTSYKSVLDDLTNDCVKWLTLDPLDPSQDLAPDLSSISLHVYGEDGDGDYPSGDLLAEMILFRWAHNPHTTFKLDTPYTGPNPLSDPRIARQMQYNPGLLVFTGQQH